MSWITPKFKNYHTKEEDDEEEANTQRKYLILLLFHLILCVFRVVRSRRFGFF